MKIAVPLVDGKLSAHFGHCQQFAIVEIDKENNKVNKVEMLEPPRHEPGVLPKWLSDMQVELVIAGGMGQRAQQLFNQNGIKTIVGASDDSPEELAMAYLENRLEAGDNICDH